jgi:DNA-binding CsgD family transcriptional regulator/tetratricopeptide (TPR) repeat protein
VDLPLVGREAELAVLTAALTPGPGPHAVVLVGEAGVGKTRLVGEAIRLSTEAGVHLLSGGCLPLASTLPFLPITEALHGLDPALLDRCAPYVRSEVARLMPAWGTAPDSPIDGWEQGRLFAALRDLLAADGQPALVIEDLHWADASTVDFLAYLGAVGGSPLVLTCREEEIGTRLTEFSWRPGVLRLPLPRLSRDEVAQHLDGLLGHPPVAGYVDEVYARTGGNAFFTEQLVAAGSRELPEGLVQLLSARADAVDAEAREVLGVLSIAGRPLGEDVLDRPGLTAAIRRLIAAWLVEASDPDGRYRLRHALVGEAVTAAMTAGERREGHARLARRLDQVGAAPGEIAGHWAAAGAFHEEAPLRLAAARAAEKVSAFREAATHWLRLIELAPRARVADLPDLYLSALSALDRCGDAATASAVAGEAVRTLGKCLDRRRLALLHERVAGYRWLTSCEAALPSLETAMDLLAGLPPGRELAIVLHSYGLVLTDVGRIPQARAVFERGLEACRVAGLTAERVKLLRNLGGVTLIDGDLAAGFLLLIEAAELAARHGDPVLVAGVASTQALSLLVHGKLAEAAELAVSALAEARRAGLDRHYTVEFLAAWHFEALAALGRPAEAATAIPATIEATSIGFAALARAYLEVLAGDHATAAARLVRIDAVMSPVNFDDGTYLCNLGEIDLWLGRPAEALDRIRGLRSDIDPAVYRQFAPRLFRIAVEACADLADAARARGDPQGVAEAQNAADDLVELHARTRPDPFGPHPVWVVPPAEGASWRAELTRVAGKPDPAAWAEAASAWERLGYVHRAAYARWRQGEALLATGRRADAGRILRVSATAAHGHAPIENGIRETIRLARLTIPERTEHTPYGLTVREKAVLALVAEGLTNVQIGRRLYISDSTVSVHLTNLMRKLDVTNRAQAAARGQRAGLLPEKGD